MTNKEIAKRINAHLKRFEADPKINTEIGGGIHKFHWPSAGASGAKISVTRVSFQRSSKLTRAEAIVYLRYLDEGREPVNRHSTHAIESMRDEYPQRTITLPDPADLGPVTAAVVGLLLALYQKPWSNTWAPSPGKGEPSISWPYDLVHKRRKRPNKRMVPAKGLAAIKTAITDARVADVAIEKRITAARAAGLARGRNLLVQLAAGEITAAEVSGA